MEIRAGTATSTVCPHGVAELSYDMLAPLMFRGNHRHPEYRALFPPIPTGGGNSAEEAPSDSDG